MITTISLPAFSRPLRHLQRRPGRRAGRDADQQSLLGRHAPRDRQRVVVRHPDHLVVDLRVENRRARSRRRCPGSDAAPRRRPTAPATRPARRPSTCTPGLRAFSTSPTPVIVPPVPMPDTKMSTLPSGVAPDLLRRGRAVDLRIGGVLELLRNEIARIGGGHLGWPSLMAPVMPSGTGRQDEFGAVGLEQQPPFAAHRLRHHERALDAPRRADHGQPDAGVAARSARARSCRA